MIISHKHNYIFFKPLKTAGSSIEAALSLSLGSEDVYTGKSVKEELSLNEYDLRPKNNWKPGRVIEGQTMIQYLEKNNALHLLNNHKNIQLVDPIYHSHFSPKDLMNMGIRLDRFKTITMIRNPFDVIVSYFWWSFEPTQNVFSPIKKANKMYSTMKPLCSDTQKKLQEKIERFYSLPANFPNDPTLSDKNLTILEWLGHKQNEFYEFDTDVVLRYESLKQDFDRLCDLLMLERRVLPRLKSSQRKSSHSFESYYSKKFKFKVDQIFEKTLNEYNNDFRE